MMRGDRDHAHGFVPASLLKRLDVLEAANELRAREIAGVRRRVTDVEAILDVDAVTIEATDDVGELVDVDGCTHHLEAGDATELHPAVAQVLVDHDVAEVVDP